MTRYERVAFAADIEQGADMGMRQSGNRARLPFEPLSRIVESAIAGDSIFSATSRSNRLSRAL